MPKAARQTTKYPGVYKRKIEGGRQTVYDISYRDAHHKQRWEYAKFTNLEDANKRRIQLLAERNNGSPIDGHRVTLNDFAIQTWLPTIRAKVAESKLRSSTATQYEADLRNHVLPAFGTLAVAQINNPAQIEDFRDTLLAAGKSPDTTIRIVNTLGYAMKHAKKRRLVNYNPVSDAEKPSPRRRTPTLPTLTEIYGLADAMPTREGRNLVLLAAFTGARVGELFGLRWENVETDTGNETIRIVEQVYKGTHVPTTKTTAGRREVVLNEVAAAALRDQWTTQQVDNRPNPLGLVFPSPEGTYWRDYNFNRRVWQKARIAAGLPDLKFHTLRYFYVSQIRNLGLPSAVTEQMVGHTDEQTHRQYTRLLPGVDKAIREAQAGVFARPEVPEAR